jgi:N-acetylmuramoyl-L-alanine amidase
MRWSRRHPFPVTLLLLLCCSLLASVADPAKQLTVYTPQISYSVDVLERDGQLYVDPAALVQPLGTSALRNDGREWKLQLNGAEARFTEGKDKARVRGDSIDLGGNVRVEDRRLLMPLKSSFAILGALLHKPVIFRPEARRIFLDNAATRFTAELRKSDKSALALNFNQSVHPQVLQEEGSVKLLFKREPLVSDITSQPFDDKLIHAVTFSEDNGTASLLISGPGLNASVSPDGKTIVIQSAAPPVAAAAVPQTPSLPPQLAEIPATPVAPASANPAHVSSEFFVLIDASHGGDDQGAALGDKVLEKDVTLALARRMKTEFQDRGIAVRLLRDSDTGMSMEQRAETANEQHAGIYLALHAGLPGQGVRIYTPSLPASPVSVGKFLPWESAQSPYLGRSRDLAKAVSGELAKKQVAVLTLSVPVRPLNNVSAPAIAVELAPDPQNVQDVNGQKFQGEVAAAVASGIAQVKKQLEEQR